VLDDCCWSRDGDGDRKRRRRRRRRSGDSDSDDWSWAEDGSGRFGVVLEDRGGKRRGSWKS